MVHRGFFLSQQVRKHLGGIFVVKLSILIEFDIIITKFILKGLSQTSFPINPLPINIIIVSEQENE